jgi:hypothetical protein
MEGEQEDQQNMEGQGEPKGATKTPAAGLGHSHLRKPRKSRVIRPRGWS